MSDAKLILLKDKITHLTGDGRYSWVHLEGGKKYVSCKTLKAWVAILDESLFARIHRSHIVNLKFIQDFETSGTFFITSVVVAGQTLDVSRRNQSVGITKKILNFV